jgi:hypothetical protein
MKETFVEQRVGTNSMVSSKATTSDEKCCPPDDLESSFGQPPRCFDPGLMETFCSPRPRRRTSERRGSQAVHRELLAQHRGSRSVGDQVVFGGTVHTVVAISGTKIRLLSDAGEAGYR